MKSEEERIEQAALAQLDVMFAALVDAMVRATDPEQVSDKGDRVVKIKEAAARFRRGVNVVRMAKDVAVKAIKESV